MTKRTKATMLGMFIFSFFVAMAAAAYLAPLTDEVTIMGIVNSIDWDEDDNVIAVAITVSYESEPEEEEEPVVFTEDYVVSNNEKGKELLTYIGKTVEATGAVVEDEDGNKTISVSSYKVIEEEQR